MEQFGKTDFDQLKNELLTMGGYVERALEEATQALVQRDPKRLDNPEKFEKEINKSHVLIDKHCLNLLAKLSPFATDLRRILASIKINNDLERMGDLAVNISRNVKLYLSHKELPVDKDFLLLISEVQWMVKNVLDAFVSEDKPKAEEVLQKDDVVDELRHKINASVRQLMKQDAAFVDSGVDFIFIAKNLERMGDHATNIAEDIIFILSGDDIRHGGLANDKT